MNKLSSFIEKKCPWHNLQLKGPDLSCEKCGFWTNERVNSLSTWQNYFLFIKSAMRNVEDGSELRLQLLKEYYDEQ